MKEYHKIQSIFKRDEKTFKFLVGQYALPEFEYLKNNKWSWTEKIDGTNIRIMWFPQHTEKISVITNSIYGEEEKIVLAEVIFRGKTDNAQIPDFLLAKLQEIFTVDKMMETFPEINVCLYGEGYGARIQKGGGNYISNGVDFILIDVLIDAWWLKRNNIEGIANKLGIKVVPIVGSGTLEEAVEFTRKGYTSTFGNFLAEGIVLKPEIELKMRNGDRLITKMKYKDF